VTATFETLCQLDERLVARGHHPLTPWWRVQLARWYATPGAVTFVGRVGRGGAKSHTSVKVSLNETLFGDWKIPPGERHFWAYVSKTKDEATQRLALIERLLADLSIAYDRQGDEIALRDVPRGWRVFAATIGAVSGFRCFGYSADELAKWQAGPELANPAIEVCGSLNAMTITHPGARRVLISSPLGGLDYHFERFERGDSDDQIVAHAASWVANPAGITEEQTRKAEPNEKVWNREYRAIPQANYSNAFDADAVARAFRPAPAGSSERPICVVDASSGKGDAFTWGIVGYVRPTADHVSRYQTRKVPRRALVRIGGVDSLVASDETLEEIVHDVNGPVTNPDWLAASKPVLVFHHMDAVEGRFAGTVSGSAIVDKIAKDCKRFRAELIVGDQREAFFLHGECQRHGLRFVSLDWTNANKIEAVTRLKRLFAEGATALPPRREKLRRELLNYSERITASGAIVFNARGTGHDDEAALCLTAAMAEIERLVPGSPAYFPNTKTVSAGR
jgi:hypothetical protein